MGIISLIIIPPNNHGCKGDGIKILPLDSKRGIVIDRWWCTTCNFDEPDLPEIGDIVELPPETTWENASDWEIDEDSFSFAGTTAVNPYTLRVVVRDKELKERVQAFIRKIRELENEMTKILVIS